MGLAQDIAMLLSEFAMGFVVSLDGQSLLLLQKGRPDYLAGKWMGLAGHIEPGETPLEAVRRETLEEGNLDIADWQFIKIIDAPEKRGAKIHAFMARADISKAVALTDEPIRVFSWDEIDSLALGNAAVEVLDQVRAFAQPGRFSARRRP